MSENKKQSLVITEDKQVKDLPVLSKKEKLLNFLQSALEFYDPKETISKLDNFSNSIKYITNKLNEIATQIVDQVEVQIINLKTSILSLNEILPVKALTKTGIYVFNTTKENFLNCFQSSDIDIIEHTKIGSYICQINITAHLVTKNAVHGVFVFFPLGDSEKSTAESHVEALQNFANLAERHMFEIYFHVDNCAVIGKQKYSELPDDITQWIRSYEESTFFTLLKEIPLSSKRRLCNVFNPWLVDTERLQEKFPKGSLPQQKDQEMIDYCCWASPVALLAKILTENYEVAGWAGNLFGIQTCKSITSYKNFNAHELNSGRSFGENSEYKYTLTLWNFVNSTHLPKLQNCMLTPIQRQPCLEDGRILEKLAFVEAQTLLPKPKGFEEISSKEYKELSQIQKEDYDRAVQQMMYNSLGTALIEDTIFQGLILVTRPYIGKTASQSKDMEKRLVDYMSIFANRENYATEDNRFVPAILRYQILQCEIKSQKILVKISVVPNQHIRRIDLGVSLEPGVIETDQNTRTSSRK